MVDHFYLCFFFFSLSLHLFHLSSQISHLRIRFWEIVHEWNTRSLNCSANISSNIFWMLCALRFKTGKDKRRERNTKLVCGRHHFFNSNHYSFSLLFCVVIASTRSNAIVDQKSMKLFSNLRYCWVLLTVKFKLFYRSQDATMRCRPFHHKWDKNHRNF